MKSMNKKPIITTLLLTTLIGIVAHFTIAQGKGGIIQFSPTSFQRRTCIEYQIPLTGIQIYQGKWQYDTPTIFQFCKDRGYLQVKDTQDQKWIQTCHWSMQWRDGHSQFHKLFFWYGDDLLKKSQNNLELSDVVWPRVLFFIGKGDDTGIEIGVSILGKISWDENPQEFGKWYEECDWEGLYDESVESQRLDRSH